MKSGKLSWTSIFYDLHVTKSWISFLNEVMVFKKYLGIWILILQNKFDSIFNNFNSFNHFSSISFLFVHYSSKFWWFCFLAIAPLYICCRLKWGLAQYRFWSGRGRGIQLWPHFGFIKIFFHICGKSFFDPFKFLCYWISFGFDFV